MLTIPYCDDVPSQICQVITSYWDKSIVSFALGNRKWIMTNTRVTGKSLLPHFPVYQENVLLQMLEQLVISLQCISSFSWPANAQSRLTQE